MILLFNIFLRSYHGQKKVTLLVDANVHANIQQKEIECIDYRYL